MDDVVYYINSVPRTLWGREDGMTSQESQDLVTMSPGVGNAYANAWRQLWPRFLDLLLAGIVYVAMVVPVGIIFGLVFTLDWASSATWGLDFSGVSNAYVDLPWGAQVVDAVINIIYFTPLMYGLLFVALAAARADRYDLGNIFVAFKRNYVNVIIVGVLFWLIFSLPSLIISLVTSAVPILGAFLAIAWVILAVILYCKLAFVPFLLTDRTMGATESIRTSWQWTNGHALEIFVILLLAVPILIAGVIAFVVGVIPAIMWVALAVASQYHAVSLQREAHVAYPSPMVP